MTPDTPQGIAPENRPFHPESTIIQRSITTLEASSLLLERLHLQDNPRLMLGIVADQLQSTLADLEALRRPDPEATAARFTTRQGGIQ